MPGLKQDATQRACACQSLEACLHVQAAAFSDIFVSAGTCGCRVDAFFEGSSLEDIWAEAAASAYAEACISVSPLTMLYITHYITLLAQVKACLARSHHVGVETRRLCLCWRGARRNFTNRLSHSRVSCRCCCNENHTLIPGVRSAAGAGDIEAFVQALSDSVMDDMATASSLLITSAVTQANDAGESCNTNIIACTNAERCARPNSICRAPGETNAIPCCGDDSVCIRRTETESRCRSVDLPVPSFWLGGEDVARICLDQVSTAA